MNFKTIIEIIEKIYRFLEKFNLESSIDIDTILDNNYPEISSGLQQYIKNHRIAFCSTNGKKTSLDIFNQILKANNEDFITNITKTAKVHSVLTSIILNNTEKKYKRETTDNILTIATDANQLNKNFKLLNFDYLVLGNVFKTHDDFFTLYEKKKRIQDAILLNSKLNLIINADEPVFFEIDNIKNDTATGKKRYKFFYGINEVENFNNHEQLIHRNDIIKCPHCGCLLQYKKRFYSHLGNYFCECGFRRPKLDMYANIKVFSDYSFMEVFYNDKKMVFKLPLGSVYNAYNILGAIALATVLKIDRKTISNAFENYEFFMARDEILNYKDKKTKVKIIKNSTSLSEAAFELTGEKNKKVIFVFDSNYVDGIDTSWIWEANLSCFKNFDNRIFVTGKRYDDMALRLKHAGANPSTITMDNQIKNAINACYWSLEKNEEMLILTVPSLAEEVYKCLN